MKDAAIDLKTMLTADFVHTNVGTISADPAMKYFSDVEATTYESNGEIVIRNERAGKPLSNGSYQAEQYLMDCFIVYEKEDATSPAIIKAILKEIERVFNAENNSNTRTYDWQLESNWPGPYQIGIVNFVVIATTLTYAVNT